MPAIGLRALSLAARCPSIPAAAAGPRLTGCCGSSYAGSKRRNNENGANTAITAGSRRCFHATSTATRAHLPDGAGPSTVSSTGLSNGGSSEELAAPPPPPSSSSSAAPSQHPTASDAPPSSSLPPTSPSPPPLPPPAKPAEDEQSGDGAHNLQPGEVDPSGAPPPSNPPAFQPRATRTGYGSARARAARNTAGGGAGSKDGRAGGAAADDGVAALMPPLSLPAWFARENVARFEDAASGGGGGGWMYESALGGPGPAGGVTRGGDGGVTITLPGVQAYDVAAASDDGDEAARRRSRHAEAHAFLWRVLDAAAWDGPKVHEALRNAGPDEIARRGGLVAAAATCLVVELEQAWREVVGVGEVEGEKAQGVAARNEGDETVVQVEKSERVGEENVESGQAVEASNAEVEEARNPEVEAGGPEVEAGGQDLEAAAPDHHDTAEHPEVEAGRRATAHLAELLQRLPPASAGLLRDFAGSAFTEYFVRLHLREREREQAAAEAARLNADVDDDYYEEVIAAAAIFPAPRPPPIGYHGFRRQLDLGIRTGFPLPQLPELDPAVCHQVLSTLRGALNAAASSSSSPPPVSTTTTVLVPNHAGRAHTRHVVRQAALDLGADAVRLDAQDLALLVGAALSPASAAVTQLGYAAAELSGRLLRQHDWPARAGGHAAWGGAHQGGGGGGGGGMSALGMAKPLRVRLSVVEDLADVGNFLAGAGRGRAPSGRGSDEVWDNLKIKAVLKKLLLQAAGNKPRSRSSRPQQQTRPSSRPLIVHVDDYVELSMTDEGARVLGKLREVMDDMWRDGGRATLLVGTSSTDAVGARYARALDELAQRDHVILMPVKLEEAAAGDNAAVAADARDAESTPDRLARWARLDTLRHNEKNLVAALGAMASANTGNKSPPPDVELDMVRAFADSPALGTAVLPRPAISQLASVVLGLRRERPGVVDADLLAEAVALLTAADESVRRSFWLDRSPPLSALTSSPNPPSSQPNTTPVVPVSFPFTPFVSEPVPLPDPADQDYSSSSSSSSYPSSAPTPGGSTSTSPIPPVYDALGNAVDLSTATEHEKRLLSGLVRAESIRTTFADVHAPAETVDALKTLTSLALLRPDAFGYGVLATERIPGCLLYGPPGTGKTLLAKAVARESGANMLEVSGASIMDMWVGESEKNVRALFSLARKLAPLVVFIDEADALLGTRSARNTGGHRETINQFLREWDGLTTGATVAPPPATSGPNGTASYPQSAPPTTTPTEAFIMVATNRPFDLDDAVLRRLPRRLLVDLPTQADRAEILRILLRDELLEQPASSSAATVVSTAADADKTNNNNNNSASSPALSVDSLAADTPNYSGSDLKNLCVAAAMAAVREEMQAEETQLKQQQQQQSASGADSKTPAPNASPQQQPTARRGRPPPLPPRKAAPVVVLSRPRRVLARRHFDKALREIGASVGEDMATLGAIRRFDEAYGDGRGRRARKVFGFESDKASGEAAKRGGGRAEGEGRVRR